MPDDSDIDPIFGDMSQYPSFTRDDLTPEEQEMIDNREEPLPDEHFINQFVERFGYRPKIKEWGSFMFYVLSDFDPMWRDEAIEVEHEHP